MIAKKQNVMQKGRFLELVSFLDEQTPKGDTYFYDAIKTCGNLCRGISIVISDFMTDSQIEQGVALLQTKTTRCHIATSAFARRRKTKRWASTAFDRQ